jgi:hypothetical protein
MWIEVDFMGSIYCAHILFNYVSGEVHVVNRFGEPPVATILRRVVDSGVNAGTAPFHYGALQWYGVSETYVEMILRNVR